MKNILEKDLVYKYENILYKISFISSIILWSLLTLFTLGIGLIYIGIGALIGLIIHILFISNIKGNGVKVTKEQFPELDKIKKEIAKKMGFKTYTNMYIIDYGGILNAFATKLLSRNFIIITSNLLEACENDIDKLKFIIGHELAHIKRGHVKMQAFLSISKIIPWLGNAYSKACEYTCDNYGVYYGLDSDYKKAIKGLAVLSVGGIYSERINIEAFLVQANESNDFWMSLNETNMTHPYLTKRVFNIIKTFKDNNIKLPKRNIFGILLAPFTNIWLWIIIIYIGLFFGVILDTFNNLKDNISKDFGFNNSILTEKNIENGLKKKLDLVIDNYLKHKNNKKYNLYLLHNGFTYSNIKGEKINYLLKVINVNNNKIYFEYKKLDRILTGTINKNDKLLWGFEYYVNKNINLYDYYTESDSLEDLKNIK